MSWIGVWCDWKNSNFGRYLNADVHFIVAIGILKL